MIEQSLPSFGIVGACIKNYHETDLSIRPQFLSDSLVAC